MLERLTANWPLKLLALALAFAVWVSITGENDVVRDFPVPLEIRLPGDLTLAAEAPTSVTLRLRAPETSMRRMDPLGLGVRVLVERGISGQRDITITEDNVTGVPRGVELDFITPNRLRLDVEQLIRRLIPVEATFAGEPPDGYAFYAAQVVPDSVTVEGPVSAVEGLELLRTPTVRIDQFTRPFEVTVPLAPGNPQLRVLSRRAPGDARSTAFVARPDRPGRTPGDRRRIGSRASGTRVSRDAGGRLPEWRRR
jgi:hypothetical protein